MGTLGKAVGASGSYICGSRPLIDLLVNRARSFIFSTAPVPAAAAAAAAGIKFIQSNEGKQRCRQLWERVTQGRAGILPAPDRLEARPTLSAILPVIIGDEAGAVATSAALRERDIFVPAIRYPTVARGQARLRVTLTATHAPDDISQLAAALESVRKHK
jgi:7-keto-8-aminopelargonate synthetase-like enzyme